MKGWLLGVSSVAVLGVGLAASLASGPAPGSGRGREHVEKTCLRCHAGPQLDALVRARLANPAQAPALEAFLARHHASDPALRAEVLEQLHLRVGLVPGVE